MRKFQTSNGFTMLACEPLSFKEESVYVGSTDPKVYTISVGTMSEMYNCCYEPETSILSIGKVSYSENVCLSFYCTSFEQASIIIYSFGIGTFDADIFNETIFILKS